MEINYQSIGVTHSPYTIMSICRFSRPAPRASGGRIELAPEWIPALLDLDGFSHLILLYHFHQIGQWVLEVTPFLDTQPRGLFATRTPQRPNPIG